MSDTTTASNGLVDVAQAALVGQVEHLNSLVELIHSADTDPGRLIADIRDDENASDATVKAFQNWREQAQAAIEAKTAEINEHIKAHLMPKAQDIDVDALKTEYSEGKKVVSQGLVWLKSLPGFNEETSPIPALKSLRGGTVSAGGTTGTRRPRVEDILVNGKSVAQDVKNAKTGVVTRKANFSYAAATISKDAKAKVEVSDLQSAAFSAAKTDDLNSLNGEPFSFNYNVGEGDAVKTYDVKVYPRTPDDSEKREASAPAETVADNA